MRIVKKLIKMKIDNFGIWFNHRGDEIYYTFPWIREKFNQRFYSISFCTYFKTLKELDDMWDGYNKDMYGENN
jgi:hypothetical protein